MRKKKVTHQELAEVIEDAIFHSSENTGLLLAIDISTALYDQFEISWRDSDGVDHGDSNTPPE